VLDCDQSSFISTSSLLNEPDATDGEIVELDRSRRRVDDRVGITGIEHQTDLVNRGRADQGVGLFRIVRFAQLIKGLRQGIRAKALRL
jgi:hypothetical protein